MTTQSNASLIKNLTKKISNNIRVAMPATIEEYDFTTQKASVQIDIQELFDNETSIDYPVISDVPVMFPRSGGASFTMPVQRGDTCLVIFNDRDITKWLLGSSKEKPNSQRMHDLNDAVILMGLTPFSTKSLAQNNTDILLTYDGSDIALKPGGQIDINSANSLNIKSKDIAIECKNTTIKASGDIEIFAAKAITIKAENISINCTNAEIKASGEINTSAPTFKQKGKFIIDGNLEVTGSSALAGNITCDSSIKGASVKTTGGVNLETHKHTYNEATNGSNPTVVIPSITGKAT
jgi:phage gp45-like